MEATDVVIPGSQERHVPTKCAVIIGTAEAVTAIVDVLPPSHVVAEVLYGTCLVVESAHPSRIVGTIRRAAVVVVLVHDAGVRRARSKECRRGQGDDCGRPCNFLHILILIFV